MGMGFYIFKMEDTTKANGRMIKWMVLGNFIMKMVKLLTKVIGKMTNLMAKEEYTTVNLLLSKDSLITKIFPSWEIIGYTTKANLEMTQNMEKDI